MSYFYGFRPDEMANMSIPQFQEYFHNMATVMRIMAGKDREKTPAEIAQLASIYGVKGPIL